MSANGWVAAPGFNTVSTTLSNTGQLISIYSTSNSASSGTWYTNTSTGVYFLATNSNSSITKCNQQYSTANGYSAGTSNSAGSINYTTATSNSCVPLANNTVTYNSSTGNWTTANSGSVNASASTAKTKTTSTTNGDTFLKLLQASPLFIHRSKTQPSDLATQSSDWTKPANDIPLTGICTDVSETIFDTSVSIDGDSLLSVTGSAEAIQATSLSVDSFSGNFEELSVEGDTDCGGECFGGGEIEGSVDLEASGYIEMTDLNIDDANISINTGGEATIGWAAPTSADELDMFSCATNTDLLGVTDMGGVTSSDKAIAIGPSTFSKGGTVIGAYSGTGNSGVAVGEAVGVEGTDALGMGLDVVVAGNNSAAVGVRSAVIGKDAVAVGVGARSEGDKTVAMGSNVSATGKSAIALGQDMRSTHDQSIAIGTKIKDPGKKSISIGRDITQILDSESVFAPNSSAAIAIGDKIRSMGNKSIGIGSGIIVAGDNISDYTGSFILSTNEGQIGIGKGSSIGMTGISIGSYNALGDNVTAIGYGINLPKISSKLWELGLRA